MMRIEALIAAVALTLAVGFGAGYYTKGQFAQAKVVKQVTAAVKQAGTNIVQSAEESQRVEASIQQSDNQIDQLRKAAVERLQKGKAHDEQRIAAGGHAGNADRTDNDATAAQSALVEVRDGADDCAGDRLDFGTVRLLNRAREDDTAVESATGSAR